MELFHAEEKQIAKLYNYLDIGADSTAEMSSILIPKIKSSVHQFRDVFILKAKRREKNNGKLVWWNNTNRFFAGKKLKTFFLINKIDFHIVTTFYSTQLSMGRTSVFHIWK